MTVKGTETKDGLSGTQSDLQYSGETVQTQIMENPGKGNMFLIVQMVVEKTQAGTSAFSWDRLFVMDSGGTRYSRSDNDSFLENYGYTRIKSTDLTIGTNEGAACFEIPSSSVADTLMLVYESDEGNISIPLK